MDREANFFDKTPFYMTYPMQNLYEAEMEYEKDMERVKQWHPKEVQRIQKMVDERCDELEYEGSRLFDEEPDRNMMQREAEVIYQRIRQEGGQELPKEELPKKELPKKELPKKELPKKEKDKKLYFEDFSDYQLEAASCEFGRRCDDWLSSVVEILFYNEAYRRRCRHRRCRRWW